MKPELAPSFATTSPQRQRSSDRLSLSLVYFIYFFCGMAQCIESVFFPEFKQWFGINYQHQGYIMAAKNIPFVMAGLIGLWLARAGYRTAFIYAMSLYAIGAGILLEAMRAQQLSLLLCGFFVIGVGFNVQLVAGNPLIMAVGPSGGASSRLNLANALGAVAQIIAPALVWLILPATATLQDKIPWIESMFGGIALMFVILTFLSRLFTDPPQARQQAGVEKGRLPGEFWWALTAIVFALGAEASVFSFFRNFLEDPKLGGVTSSTSQLLFTVYLALFAAGRLLAAAVQTKFSAAKHLILHLAGAAAFVTALLVTHGKLSAAVLVALGFWISIFFPTLYALAIRGLGPLTSRASGLLTMGFLGCAVFPVLQGHVADSIGLQQSFVCCIAAYAVVFTYALRKASYSSKS